MILEFRFPTHVKREHKVDVKFGLVRRIALFPLIILLRSVEYKCFN